MDLLVGEPPSSVHPVAWFGRVVSVLEDRVGGRRPRTAGAAVAAVLPLAAAGVVYFAVELSGFDPFVELTVAGAALYFSTSLRMLVDEAEKVIDLSYEDVEEARSRLPGLVGRNPSNLSPDEIRSAAVESAAENLSDGLVAPLTAFTLLAPLSVSAGAAGAAYVKAVNTLDSMLGYPSKPLGEASAVLDDAVMWLPARATAFLVGVVSGAPKVIGEVRERSRRTSSPNSGWPMASVAVALGVNLSKPGEYSLNDVADLPTVEEAKRGVRAVATAGMASYGICATVVTLV